jgi:hypothetical protein
MSPQIIGLYSSAPQSGKSTVAKYLHHAYGYKIIPFALTLKEMLVPMLTAYGYSEYEARHYIFNHKQHRLDYLGVTVRHLLQTLGTEWGRQCVHPHLWTECWKRQVARHAYVVVDDVRFVNEAELVQLVRGGDTGALWRVDRPGAVRGPAHASEGGLDAWVFDHVVNNDSTVDKLYESIDRLMH